MLILETGWPNGDRCGELLVVRRFFLFRVSCFGGLFRPLELVGQFGDRPFELLEPVRLIDHDLVQLVVIILQMHQRQLKLLQPLLVRFW